MAGDVLAALEEWRSRRPLLLVGTGVPTEVVDGLRAQHPGHEVRQDELCPPGKVVLIDRAMIADALDATMRERPWTAVQR